MFAFALWDRDQRHLILARDRLGKKPLYYCCTGGALYFGSEIKAVVGALPGPPSIDDGALDEYLSFGFIGEDRTIYRGIRQIRPGMMLVATGPSEMRLMSYWQPRWEPKRNLTFPEAVDQAEALLTEAVRLRIRADVPVGVFLSGGIDSGLVAAITSKLVGGCLTLSVGFDEESFDERPSARQVARRYGTEHHECVLRPDVVSLIPRMAWHYDQPFGDASAIASFALAAYARQHVKVVLNGDGGDEVFGGYRRHIASRIASRIYRLVPRDLVRQGAQLFLRFLPAPRSFRSAYTFGHRFLHVLAGNPWESITALYAAGFTDAEKRALHHIPPEAGCASAVIGTLLTSLRSLNDVDRALAMDLVWELPGDLLVKMDIATMAYGLEARSPFLDHEIVSWANTLPGGLRLGGWSTKPILRELATRYLPHSVTRAPKRGFEAPISKWLRKELAEMRDDLILSRSGLVCSLFERSRLERLLRESSSDSGHWGQTVWILLMLAAWERYSYQVVVQARREAIPA
jgi:asparagine synthase (glutamine-hydrolysing)